jgi:hypothetical protein
LQTGGREEKIARKKKGINCLLLFKWTRFSVQLISFFDESEKKMKLLMTPVWCNEIDVIGNDLPVFF